MVRLPKKGRVFRLRYATRLFVFGFCLWTALAGVGFAREAMSLSGSHVQACGLENGSEDQSDSVKYVVALLPTCILQTTAKSNFRPVDLNTLSGPSIPQSQIRILASHYARRWLEIRRLSRQVSWPLRC